MLTVHHLQRSQSERIVWLCEELDLIYDLRCWPRDPATLLAPAGYKALHPAGSAPVIVEGRTVLAESGAIVEYLLARHGQGRLVVAPPEPGYADYLYWLHFANGTLQPALSRLMFVRRGGVAEDHPVRVRLETRVRELLGLVDARAGAAPWLAGEAFSAADVMTVFPLTTMRSFVPVDIAPYPALRGYLQRVAGRQAYRRAMAKGDPGMSLLLD